MILQKKAENVLCSELSVNHDFDRYFGVNLFNQINLWYIIPMTVCDAIFSSTMDSCKLSEIHIEPSNFFIVSFCEHFFFYFIIIIFVFPFYQTSNSNIKRSQQCHAELKASRQKK